MRSQHRSRRQGFTLPELMVAAAMSMAIMGILAVAFRDGIRVFRNLRAVGQMQDRLRSAENVLKRDLAAEHFGGTFQQGYGGPYVRDQRLDLVGWTPPAQGYFEVRQGTPSIFDNGQAAGNYTSGSKDGDGVPSFRATDHSLRFTVRLTGKRPEDWFYAAGNGMTTAGADIDFSSSTVIASRWAEVCYFLAPNGDTAGSQPLYALYRQERQCFETGNPLQTSSIARRASRVGGTPPTFSPLGSPNPNGDDILLTDVVSFEIKCNWNFNTALGTASPQMLQFANNNFDWPFDNLPESLGGVALPADRKGVFDTGSQLDVDQNTTGASPAQAPYDWNDANMIQTRTVGGAPRLRVRLNTLQIRIRIWDRSTETARQITIVQDI